MNNKLLNGLIAGTMVATLALASPVLTRGGGGGGGGGGHGGGEARWRHGRECMEAWAEGGMAVERPL